MTENVIGQRITKWRSEQHDYPTHEAGQHAAAAVRLCADEIQAATRPEQFMPPLSEWPQGAVGIRFAHMSADPETPLVVLFEFFKKSGRYMFLAKGNVSFPVHIPPGIDPRIKVSREQMEAYENEQTQDEQ